MFWPLKRFFKYFLFCFSGVVFLTAGLGTYLIWFQPAFYFPMPTGQYAIGIKTYHWIDAGRKEILHDDPAHSNRELMVNIWYPAQGALAEKPTTHYAPYAIDYLKKNKKMLGILGLSCPIYSYAHPEALLAQDVLRYPVIIFSHGLGTNRDRNTAHCEELASYGYVVVGISHTYDSDVVQFPDGRIADKAQRKKNKSSLEKRKQLDQIDQDIEVWISDVRFVLDQLEQLDVDKASLFYQRIDKEHIGMFGHSFGGATAVQICRRDQRVKAGVNLDGGLIGPDLTKKFGKPFMFMLSEDNVKTDERPWTRDDWKRFGINSLNEEKMMKSRSFVAVKQLAKSLGHDVYMFMLKDARHMAFCDNVLLKHASFFTRFLGAAQDFGSGEIDGFRATEIVNAYLVNFFNKYLKGQPSELLDGSEKNYPEVETKQWVKK